MVMEVMMKIMIGFPKIIIPGAMVVTMMTTMMMSVTMVRRIMCQPQLDVGATEMTMVTAAHRQMG